MAPDNPIERYAGRPLYVITSGFAISLLFVLFGPYVNFSPVGYVDPWLYTGYFTNFSHVNHFHGTEYYFSRLPWTIPGVLMYRVASPAVAAILLNACLVTASVISLYFAIRWYYGTAPALLAALALATSPMLHCTTAWNYPDGPAIAYGFLGAAFALRPAGRRAVNTILMGVFLALSGFTNMSGAPMILCILVFPLWRQRQSLVGLAKEAGYILAGVAAATLALLPVSKWMLGYWPFFMKQIELAQFEMGTPGLLTRMWGSGNAFLNSAYRLFPTLFLLVFGLAVLLLVSKRAQIAWPAYVALLLCCLLYCYQEFVLHGVALRVNYHSIYLVIPTFILAGVVFGELWQHAAAERDRRDYVWKRDWIALAAVALFVVALPFLGDAWRSPLFAANLWSDMTVAGIVALVLLAGWRSAPAVFRIPLALLLAVLLFAGPLRELNVLLSLQPRNREGFETLMSLQSVVKASVPADRQVLFWVDKGEYHTNLFVSAQSLWVAEPSDLTKYFTGQPPEELRARLGYSPTVVHFTDHPEKIAERRKLLDSRGVHYENPRQWMVRYGQSQFYVAAEDLTDVFGIH